jgi:hypothetical protein
MAKAFDRVFTGIKNFLAAEVVKIAERLMVLSEFFKGIFRGEGFEGARESAWATVREKLYGGVEAQQMGAQPGRAAPRMAGGRKTSEITVGAPQAADSLARIGGMVGPQTSMRRGAEERMLKIAQQQEKLQEEMAAALKNIEANTEE